MTTPPPGEEPPVGEPLWVDAEWWRAMSDPDPARPDDDAAAAALADPLTDPLPRSDDDAAAPVAADPEPEELQPGPPAQPEVAPVATAQPAPPAWPREQPEPEQPRTNDLHVPRVLPEPQPAAPAAATSASTPRPPQQAPRTPPAGPLPAQRRDRRRVGPVVKSRLADLALLLLALGVVALVYFALTR